MLLNRLLSGLFLGSLVEAIPSSLVKRAAPVLPLSTKGRDVVDAKGNVFKYAATNWPGKPLDAVLGIYTDFGPFAQAIRRS
jgi:endoglucanase